MYFPSIYIILAIFIYGMNVVPAFMPPTWLILAFFNIHYHLSIPIVVIIGAVCATLGRITLYYVAKYQFRRFFSKKSQQNLEYLREFFHTRKKISIPLLILYAFLPIPSNDVYMAAGVARINIKIFAAAFFIGRVISYSFWVTTSHFAVKDLSLIFGRYYSHLGAIIIDIIGFFMIFLIGRINWQFLLPKKIIQRN